MEQTLIPVLYELTAREMEYVETCLESFRHLSPSEQEQLSPSPERSDS